MIKIRDKIILFTERRVYYTTILMQIGVFENSLNIISTYLLLMNMNVS